MLLIRACRPPRHQAAVTAVAPRPRRGSAPGPRALGPARVVSDGRSPASRVVETLLVELRRRGATAISAPRCADCDEEMRTFGIEARTRFCRVCGPARVTCTACESLRRVGSLDRDGRPFCYRCPPAGEDPISVVTRVVTGVDPSLDPTVVVTAVQATTSRSGQRRPLAWALEDHPGLLTGDGAEAPVPSVLRLIDALRAAGSTSVVRPPCPHCARAVRLSCIPGRPQDLSRLRGPSTGRAVFALRSGPGSRHP